MNCTSNESRIVEAPMTGCQGLNDRLDEQDKQILAQTIRARSAVAEPMVGDVVLWPNGQERRISDATWDFTYQTSARGSYHINVRGYSSFSGALFPTVLREFLVATSELRPAEFWFFHHNVPGGGRAVYVAIPVKVWKLVPFSMTQEQAEAHPRALASLACWGTRNDSYLSVVKELMRPRVMDDPDHY